MGNAMRRRRGAIPSREQVLASLRAAHGDRRAAARALGIPAGLVHMIETGRPADGDPDGDQSLVNPPPHNPTRKQHVLDWVARRARRDLSEPRP